MNIKDLRRELCGVVLEVAREVADVPLPSHCADETAADFLDWGRLELEVDMRIERVLGNFNRGGGK